MDGLIYSFNIQNLSVIVAFAALKARVADGVVISMKAVLSTISQYVLHCLPLKQRIALFKLFYKTGFYILAIHI